MQNRNYYDEKTDDAMDWSAFIGGGLIGAGVALLLAPHSGTELRDKLRDYANRATDDLMEKGREALDTAVERGKEYYDKGEEVVRDTGRSVRQFAEEAVKQGQEMKDAGRSAKDFAKQK